MVSGSRSLTLVPSGRLKKKFEQRQRLLKSCSSGSGNGGGKGRMLRPWSSTRPWACAPGASSASEGSSSRDENILATENGGDGDEEKFKNIWDKINC